HTTSTLVYTLSLHDALPIFRIKRLPMSKKFPALYSSQEPRKLEAAKPYQVTLQASTGSASLIRDGAVKARFKFLKTVNANNWFRSEEHTSELQSRFDLVCRL